MITRFSSYAQNFEDVMLNRCFPGNSGFYVDIGAHDPDIDSVTRAFYERGWTGINIEPLPAMAARLRERRPKDITIECAIGVKSGTVTLHDIDGSGGVSTIDQAIAAQHAAHGWQGKPIPVIMRTLADVLDTEAKGRPIDFLKIDVEGLEMAVLQGANFKRDRAKVLVIETRLPVSIDMVSRVDEVPDRFHEVSLFLKPLDYHLVYRDGTNSFFVSEEAIALKRHFQRPPGVFDQFIHVNSVREERAAHEETKDKLDRALEMMARSEGH
jgi:FkbM family methyltransferase